IRRTPRPGLAATTPASGILLGYQGPQGPFCPYRLAAQTLACRYRNFARVYVLQAVVDNPVGLAALREVWSYPAAPGTVELTGADSGGVHGLVAAPGGAALARFTLTDVEGAEAERVVIDGELTARVPPRFSTGDEEPVRLVQVNRAVALRDPTRARFSLDFSSAGDRYPWGAVPVTNLIVAVDTRADLEYTPTEHVLDYFPPT